MNKDAGDAACQAELVEFFVDSARYGDQDDVLAALAQGVPVDAADGDGGRTGASCADCKGMLSHVQLSSELHACLPVND
jgi:hypothetical protein